MSRMNPEVKKKWVAALRSGDYYKGTGALHTVRQSGHSFCVLGVLCDLAVKDGVDIPVREGDPWVSFDGEEVEPTVIPVLYGVHGQSAFPPKEVCEWAGVAPGDWCLDLPDPDVWPDEPEPWMVKVTLQELNDDWWLSFDKMADLIEEQY